MCSIVNDVLRLVILVIEIRIEIRGHQLLLKTLILRLVVRDFVIVALNHSVLVSVRNNVIFGVNFLGYLTTVDYHDKILPLLVIERIIPELYIADVGANPVNRCVLKLISHELLSNKVGVLFCLYLLSKKVLAIHGLMPCDFIRSLFDRLQVRKVLNPVS